MPFDQPDRYTFTHTRGWMLTDRCTSWAPTITRSDDALRTFDSSPGQPLAGGRADDDGGRAGDAGRAGGD